MDFILVDRRIRVVMFMGSIEVGEYILFMGGIKFYYMEFGGKDLVVVLDDVLFEEIVEKFVKGMVSYFG